MIMIIIIKITLDYNFTICRVLPLKSKSNFMTLEEQHNVRTYLAKLELGEDGVLTLIN